MYISLLVILAAAGNASAQSADALYAERADLASAQKAADLWAAEVAQSPTSFDAAWKLSRACYWLGGHLPSEKDRRANLERGIDAGRKAVAIQPSRPEGHFWIAANMGALAESFGMSQGLKYRGSIKKELETVLQLNPSFQAGSADRALGRWYFKVPRLFGGSNKRAEEHLRASLNYDPQSTVSHFFLAEVLLDEDRKDEARAELQRVLDAPINPEWAPEDREFKEQARTTLAGLQ
ncbi:MAG TPA: TRAP transporter TatT component family protein [Vicinamibacterales bacterium]|nr:TRAP transporter TatT component family protein [Vicinamibacterales bacterium]